MKPPKTPNPAVGRTDQAKRRPDDDGQDRPDAPKSGDPANHASNGYWEHDETGPRRYVPPAEGHGDREERERKDPGKDGKKPRPPQSLIDPDDDPTPLPPSKG